MTAYQSVINYLDKNCSNNDETKVFSFGLGNDVDFEFLESIAEFGRGAFTHVEDRSELKVEMIKALKRAVGPAL